MADIMDINPFKKSEGLKFEELPAEVCRRVRIAGRRLLGKHLTTIEELSIDEILAVVFSAEKCKEHFRKRIPLPLLQECVVAVMMLESSTRTRFSFEAAATRLHGSVLSLDDAKASSQSKGESFSDFVKIISQYSDAIVLRYPQKGCMQEATEALNELRKQKDRLEDYLSYGGGKLLSNCVLVNAGDGAGEHPTQAIQDFYTLLSFHQSRMLSILTPQKCDLPPLKIAFVGDLKRGRAVHSISLLLSRFNCEFYFVSPKEMMMSKEHEEKIRQNFQDQGYKDADNRIHYTSDLESILALVDTVYMTRLQKERMEEEDAKKSDYYCLTKELLQKHAQPNLKVMHPMPRVDEISKCVDDTPFALYFEQAQNGLYVRAAILALLLNSQEAIPMLLEE